FGEIIDWMLAPLLLVWPLSIVLTHYLAGSVANYSYDQALLGRVAAITRQITLNGDEPSLPAAARALLRIDESDTVYFRLATRGGRFLAGDRDLPRAEIAAGETPTPGKIYLRDGQHDGQDLRIAYTFLGEPARDENDWVLVEIAETTDQRNQLTSKIVASVALPQFAIIPLAIVLVWFGLSRGLRPLNRLRRTIETRDPGDLSPIATRRVPEELEPLVEAFNEMLGRMKGNVEAQQRFVADAAHQLRTPLTGLKTQAQFAMRETDPESLRHALRQIATGVDRAGHLANQLLTLARAASGEPAQQGHEPLDLALLLREVVEEWVRAASEKGIDLGYEADGPAPIAGNALLLRELIRNLIDNALRYTPAGGHVTCRVTVDGGSVGIEIEDNGIGIGNAQAERLFERFYRGDDSNTTGSGLGLAIVQEIAGQHTARASLQANPKGSGAIARVVFPAWRPVMPLPAGGERRKTPRRPSGR
ncbi:MAG: sensor histidine kinase N-terminal domain-containing protein, partial [Betaproteobacteria bacterium]|nr:sensor histidine kinase N-terminal domain-containing protein [Betaproteobacteria bacterium]